MKLHLTSLAVLATPFSLVRLAFGRAGRPCFLPPPFALSGALRARSRRRAPWLRPASTLALLILLLTAALVGRASAQLGPQDSNIMFSLRDGYTATDINTGRVATFSPGWQAAFGWTQDNPAKPTQPPWNGIAASLGRIVGLTPTIGATKLTSYPPPPVVLVNQNGTTPNHTIYSIAISQLTAMTTFHLISCYVAPIAASSFADLDATTQLQDLDFTDNPGITGLLADIFPTGLSPTHFTSLTHVAFTGSSLNGAVPAEVMQFTSSTQVRLDQAQFSGALPATGVTSKNLWLSGNQLGGVVPDYLRNATGTVFLRYNKLDVVNTPAGNIDTLDPLWRSTQTVPPTNVLVTFAPGTAILTWTPIAYQADGGYYEVLGAATPGGPYTTSLGKTADKTATGLTVSTAGNSYFVVRTFTPMHVASFADVQYGDGSPTRYGSTQPVPNNPNDLTSVNSAQAVEPMSLVVTTTSDVVNNADGQTSLREALAYAAQLFAQTGVAQTVTFDATVFAGAQTISLAQGELAINSSVTIQGPGANLLTIDAQQASRVFHIGSGAYNVTLSGLTVANGKVNADVGGGVFNEGGSTVTLTNSTLSGNSASAGSGGGIFNNGTMTLTNSTLSGSSARDFGGGIYNAGTMTLTNTTLSGNSASQGSGMYNQTGGNLVIRNSILWGDGGGEIVNYDVSTPTVTHSIVQGSGGSANWNGSFGTDGGGNLDMDPLFVTPITAAAPTTTGNLRLQSGSPAINAGNNGVTNPALPATDLDGNPRVIGANVDMGAYELFLPPTFANSTLGALVGSTTPINLATATGAMAPPPGGSGVFSGTGAAQAAVTLVNGQWVFTSGNLPPGVYTLTYTVTDSHGASNRANFTVTVLTSTLYVNASVAAGGTGLGDSWADAFPSLATALALADSTPGVTQIWVAQGTYQPAGPNGNRNATFQLRSGLAIYGGFSGTETQLAQRNPNPATNGTVLSGDLNGDDLGFTHNGENSYHVVTGSGTGVTAVLDGFTISGGNANGNFSQNTGGGVSNVGGSPTLTNVTFSGNSAAGGGGMVNDSSSSPTLTNVTFSGNSAKAGGGMLDDASSPTLINVTFSGNSALSGGGMANGGLSNPTLTNVTFSGNSASSGSGGGLVDDYSSPTLINVTFSGNSATYGGGMENYFSSPTLTNVTFSGNSASQGGSGMYNDGGSPTLRNCILWGDAGGEISDNNGGSTFIYSIVQGSTDTSNGNVVLDPNGSGPQFVTPINPATAPTTAGNLRLTGGSPAIDKGDQTVTNPSLPATDLDGNPRVIGANVDIGAYELFLPPTLTNSTLSVVTTGSALNLATATGASAPPQGGTSAFSGPGVSNGVFTPTTAGVYTLTYTVTDSHGASNRATFTVTVLTPTLYVNASVAAGGTGAGDSWADAFPSLATALALADSTPGVTQIWVAKGTYQPAGPNGDRNATFQLRTGLAIYGGFTGTETAPTQRNPNPATNGTILSGDLNGDDATVGNSENSYSVVTGSGTDTTAVLDGFTISGGNANGGNQSGGGMSNNDGSPTLANLTFSGNSASYFGGGMWNATGSPTLTNVTFSGNSAQYGGGMENDTGSPTLTNITFGGNSAQYGGGMANDGVPTLTNVTFSGNSAQDGGGMFNSNDSTLTNVTFSGNSAQDGGGMFNVNGGNLSIRNGILWGDGGGEIVNNLSTATVTYSIVQGSTDASNGNVVLDPTGVGPQFAAPITASAPTTTGNLRLMAGSPAINAGNKAFIPVGVTTDLDGNPRVIGANVDMGAYELFLPPTLTHNMLSAVTTGSALNLATATGASAPPPGGTSAFSGPGVSNGVFTPTTPGVYTLTYTVTDSHGASNRATFTVTVSPAFTNPTGGRTVYRMAAPLNLTTGVTPPPPAGAFSGAGVTTAGIFTPATAGLGPHPITYTVNGVSATITLTVTGVPYDLNGDGTSDFLLFDPATLRSAQWDLNGPAFVSSATGPTAPEGWMVLTTADFNADGQPDYVLVNTSTHQTAIWYMNGATHMSSAYGPTLPAGWSLVGVADFNGDGHPDYLLFNPSTGQTMIWYLNGAALLSSVNGPTLPAGWEVVGTGDFNGDGHPDYLLFNGSTLQTGFWYMNNATHLSSVLGPTLPAGWALEGTADFNGDGKPDYLIFNAGTNQLGIWFMNGPAHASSIYVPTLPGGWTVVGAGDFNGDGKPDTLIANDATGETSIWYGNGTPFAQAANSPTLPTGWSIVAAADFNADGHPDYVVFNAGTNQTGLWYMNGPTHVASVYGPTLPAGWTIAGVADINGDGKPDFVLFNASTNQTAIWYMNGPTHMASVYGPTLPAGWTIAAVADINGDGHPDFVLFNASTLQTSIWYLNGPAHQSSVYGPTLPTGWTLVGSEDFNADGQPDFVLFNPGTNQTAIWYMNGPAHVSSVYGPPLPAGWSVIAH